MFGIGIYFVWLSRQMAASSSLIFKNKFCHSLGQDIQLVNEFMSVNKKWLNNIISGKFKDRKWLQNSMGFFQGFGHKSLYNRIII